MGTAAESPLPDVARVYPITPAPEHDPRFTFGLLLDVAELLSQHGYPAPGELANRDWVELRQALFRLLYVGGEVR